MGTLTRLLNAKAFPPRDEGESFWMNMGDFRRFGSVVVCMEYVKQLHCDKPSAYTPMMVIYTAKGQEVTSISLNNMLNLVAFGEPFLVIPKAVEFDDGVPIRVLIDCFHCAENSNVRALTSNNGAKGEGHE